MADGGSLDDGAGTDGPAAGGLSPFQRRVRALARKAARLAQKAVGKRPVEGVVDGVIAGDVRGWAFDPGRPGRRVHVVARHEGKVVAEALADLTRRDLVKEGRGDGRHGFNLRLPPALLDGAPRRIRIEAVSGAGRVRLVGGDLVLGQADRPAGRPAASGTAEPAERRAPARSQDLAALLVWGGEDGAAAARTAASWSMQTWPRTALARVGGDAAAADAGPVFAAEDEAGLRAFLASAHTVILARAGDVLDPSAAEALVRTRPLGDVITWDDPWAGAAGRRPEARALGVLLGETLGGALAVRGHVWRGFPGALTQALRPGGLRRLELWLAAQEGLRWAHLPAPLASRGEAMTGWAAMERAAAEGLAGYVHQIGGGGRAGRLIPAIPVRRLTLSAWPTGGAAWAATVQALVAAAPECEIELLSAPGDEPALRVPAGARLTVRPVDAPQGGPGAWLRTLTEAATGEVVVVGRTDMILSPRSGTLSDLAAWALSPRVGGATIDVHGGGDGRLGGLALERDPGGWRLETAFDPGLEGRSRPVLAAPAAFMAVSRAKLAALGGIDERFTGDGADLDLGLRLRRMGCASVLLGDLAGSAQAGLGVDPAVAPAAFAGFDPDELAAASHAFPPPRGRPAGPRA